MAYPAANDGRMELYKQGLNDMQIAKKLNTDASSIWGWRNRLGLPHNAVKGKIGNRTPKGTNQANHEERLKLYNQGLMDYQIAERLYVEPVTIYCWRRKNGLPAHGQGGAKVSEQENNRRLAIIKANPFATNKEKARLIGLSIAGFRHWRIKMGVL